MNTSVRGRGKWGDFLVALIPVSWCCNILINSNFILRMIEWQNESSLFTIRIQGKQWYWVYKYDPNTAQAVMSIPKNIGHNRWRVTSGQESYNADTYYQAIHLAAHLEFQESYSKFIKKIDTNKKSLSSLNLSNDKVIIPTTWVDLNTDEKVPKFNNSFILNMENTIAKVSNTEFTNKASFNSSFVTTDDFEESFKMSSNKKKTGYDIPVSNTNTTMCDVYFKNTTNFGESLLNNFFLNPNQSFNAYYDFLQLDETSDADSNSRHFLTTQPFRLIRGVVN